MGCGGALRDPYALGCASEGLPDLADDAHDRAVPRPLEHGRVPLEQRCVLGRVAVGHAHAAVNVLHQHAALVDRELPDGVGDLASAVDLDAVAKGLWAGAGLLADGAGATAGVLADGVFLLGDGLGTVVDVAGNVISLPLDVTLAVIDALAAEEE